MRKKSVLLASVSLALLVGLIGTAAVWAQSGAKENPPHAVSWVRQVVLEPIQPGEQCSKVISETLVAYPSDVEQVILEPMRPEDMAPPEWKPTGTSPIVRGPSDSAEYRCVVVLEPIQPGEQFSKVVETVCSRGPIDEINGVSLASSYLIAKFYDYTNYGNLLVEYYGAEPCSPTASYGVLDLPDNFDNRFASGHSYSDCDHIYVYDRNNYTPPQYDCGPACQTFYALNDAVSSWRVTD